MSDKAPYEIYPTIQVVPIEAIKSEFERLHRRIDELEAKLLNLPNKSPKVIAKDFLKTKEVVAQFPISRATLYRLEKSGELKPTRITTGVKGKTGRKIYLRQDIEAYLEGKSLK